MQIARPSYNSKPPYLLGLLGLIPFVGAFVGLGLLLYGIFRYKDKWLILIGIFGIVFTVAVYSAMFSITMRTARSGSAFVGMAQMQLNDLVESIEFHKLQYGQYPDSLQQLPKDQHVRIIDITQTGLRCANVPFFYKKLGSQYQLCSKGIDKVLGTKDDLYPKFFVSDSSRIGFIRPK
ncbi:hypothetical protein [Flaviaesturariibacter amylovorans]|uniref:hypothetical protein n=1 Tax=Flaviaesturariibacter amylovorans TaxID=1084520 RepID=UPI0031E79B37